MPFPLRYLFATDPVAMGAVLGIAYWAIAAHLVRRAGLTQKTGRTGAVTLIQRFGSALNLNIHFHLLALDGVYELTAVGPRFRRVAAPTSAELDALLGQIVGRIARHLERRGLLVRDAEASYLSAGPGEEDGLAAVVGHSISYRIAVGPNEGRKAFTLQTLAPALTAPAGDERLAKHSGFSLHAGVAAAAHQRDKIERLCRYIARPAVATGRLSLTAQGLVRYTLKTPYRDGTTHVIFEPQDLMARLAALVPRPRVHLTRYHGVLAPHSALRALVTPAGRGKRTVATERSPAERHRAMSWAQRLKRVFRIAIDTCERCGGKVRIIASVDDPAVVARILAHLQEREGAGRTPADADTAHRGRGPPGQGALDFG
ncbi:MAG: transposase [Gammaproteobacteria bacterium]|nr:transposase [Gammaproteobacteria bacterium]